MPQVFQSLRQAASAASTLPYLLGKAHGTHQLVNSHRVSSVKIITLTLLVRVVVCSQGHERTLAVSCPVLHIQCCWEGRFYCRSSLVVFKATLLKLRLFIHQAMLVNVSLGFCVCVKLYCDGCVV